MAGHFLDSSALAKFYHTEVGSAGVEQIVLDPAASILAFRSSRLSLSSQARFVPA
jgi:hypothetical protein